LIEWATSAKNTGSDSVVLFRRRGRTESSGFQHTASYQRVL
jgi:hypothetical protein